VPLATIPLRIAQVSDMHCGTPTFEPALMESVVVRVNQMSPDLVIVVGDLTAEGYPWEYEEAASWIERFSAPKVVVPGNHDARNIGYVHFQRHFGDLNSSYRQKFDELRAERLRATGLTVVAVDSSVPDLNEGRVGREWYGWIRDQFAESDDLKIFVVHHHVVSIPGTGRERNVITDAGDLLLVLSELGLDVILSGHKHVPYFWGLNGMLICNSATAATRRVRGRTPPSFNEIVIDASTIKIHTHYEDGRRGLSAIRSRADRAAIRDAFLVTDAFRASNPFPVE
jgi:Icc protein